MTSDSAQSGDDAFIYPDAFIKNINLEENINYSIPDCCYDDIAEVLLKNRNLIIKASAAAAADAGAAAAADAGAAAAADAGAEEAADAGAEEAAGEAKAVTIKNN
jgi:hypothetical protein